MVLSGFQWFLGSYKQKGWDRNKATAEESIYACRPMVAFCRPKIHLLALGTTGKL